MQWYLKAARKGIPLRKNRISGVLYRDGNGTKEDFQKLKNGSGKAAEQVMFAHNKASGICITKAKV